MTPDVKGFDANSSLERGVTLIEASAGTGKTYSITSLVLRLVAEHGLPIDQILIVTYTRAATAELRVRVRQRLGLAVEALRRREAPVDDEVIGRLVRLADDGGASGARRLEQNLRDALEGFDAASIYTIHGFCQRALLHHAFESGASFGLELVRDTAPLLDELVDDALTRQLHALSPRAYKIFTRCCGLRRRELLALARAATEDPEMQIVPDPGATLPGPEDWIAAVDRFVALWDDQGEDAMAALEEATDQGHLSAWYRKDNTRTVGQRVAAWARGEPLPERPDKGPRWFEYFRPARIRREAASDEGRALAEHPVCQQWGRVTALIDPVRTGARVRFAVSAREELGRRNRRRHVQTYQDLLRGLAGALDDPHRGAALAGAVRQRYRAALIDEFQDTDGVQWRIFSALFGDGDSYLYLIGDPKQAIYAFRNANIHVYLEAKGSAGAGRAFTLTTNYRSDRGYLEALNHLLDRNGVFGEEEGRIDYVPLTACEREPESRLRFPGEPDDQRDAPLQLRLFSQSMAGQGDGAMQKWQAWLLLPPRVAADIVAFLDRRPEIHDLGSASAGEDGFRPVEPGDIAVLVRKHKQAADVQAALAAARVPSVLDRTGSVFDSDEALALQRWLNALAQPNRDRPARLAAVTPMIGWTGDDLRDAGDGERWARWITTLTLWRRRFSNHGFMRTFRAMLDQEGVAGRLLSGRRGERRLTNLLHLAELLHTAEQEQRLGLEGLCAWLERRRKSKPQDVEAVQMRLETDDAAVRIVTMHSSKGLEYPVVWAPYLWDGLWMSPEDKLNLRCPQRDHAAERILDLHFNHEHNPKRTHIRRAELEILRENLRLLYVTLTRAQLRCEVYWGAVNFNDTSPLGAVLHGAPEDAPRELWADRLTGARQRVPDRGMGDLLVDIAPMAERSDAVSWVECEPPLAATWTPPGAREERLEARNFSRFGLDNIWRQSSYSALTSGALDPWREQRAEAERDPDRPGVDHDEVDAAEQDDGAGAGDGAPRPEVPDGAPEVAMAPFPGGPEAGTFLHEVLEHLDFALARPGAGAGERAELEGLLADQLARHGLEVDRWLSLLTRCFTDALQTPLGAALGEARLCDVPRAARLDELRFHFPLAGGLDWRGAERDPVVTARQVSAAFALRPGDETMGAGYIEHLQALPFGRVKLAGFMTGSIDLVFRAGDRWYIADYKSNRLDPHRTGSLPAQHYYQPGLRHEMEHHHYYVQYHLYAVALHRYLGWRLGAGYSYEEHFGGVYYLFLRGMQGADTPEENDLRHGVFFDRPPWEVVSALDRLFDDPGRGGGA